VRGQGVLQEFFLDRVLVEPGDGAQPAGHSRPGPAALFQVTGERFDVRATDREQRQRPGPAPDRELAQVEGVRLPGQAAVAGQETGEREPFGVGEHGLDGDEDSGWGRGGHGHLPGQG
jgi:hypothetical protein